jgi:hypothetical protein
MGHDIGPAPDIRQPAQAAPGHEDDVEQRPPFKHARRVVHVCLNERGTIGEIEFRRKPFCSVDCGWRKVETDNLGSLLCQRQRVAPEMTLQVEDALASDVTQFARLDGEEVSAPIAQRPQIIAGCIQVVRNPLIPVGTVCLEPILCRRYRERGHHSFPWLADP